MHIAIRATQQQKEELRNKGFDSAVIIDWLEENENIQQKADAFFDLTFNEADINTNNFSDNIIVFANAVNSTCEEINKNNYVRINAWPGFLNRAVIEVACMDEHYKQQAENILSALNWKFIWTPDDYGFIAARIIAMIINEAYYALEENISTKEQIDIAMKLGTNYPYGPFEWSERIGIKRIYFLLEKLSTLNKRYTIAGLLKKVALNNKTS
jgi:3-hydroxybutyryl-CoA dehydrogenase